jgi:hypothetical protein
VTEPDATEAQVRRRGRTPRDARGSTVPVAFRLVPEDLELLRNMAEAQGVEQATFIQEIVLEFISAHRDAEALPRAPTAPSPPDDLRNDSRLPQAVRVPLADLVAALYSQARGRDRRIERA